MDWSQIQQVIRIVLYTVGGIWLGKDIADGDTFQAALGGLLNVGAFAWWWFSSTRTAESNVSGPQVR